VTPASIRRFTPLFTNNAPVRYVPGSKPTTPPPAMIEVRHLTRVFRTYKKQPGFWGGVKGLFHREFEETARPTTSVSHRRGRVRRLPRAQRRRQDHHAQDALGPHLPDQRHRARRRLRPHQARERLPPHLRPRARPEEPALVGPARHRVVHLLRASTACPPTSSSHARRARHAARRRRRSSTSWCASSPSANA
jgi:hypothetical protein